ncbi:SURF1 family-domain-containing protein [Gorgonomyces haynaldii]|nr:SURF1 family-domain-containing protein [Gorgonomyces haynaldii]
MNGGFLWAIPTTTFGLGVWQTYRLQWKLGLIEQMEQRLHMPPKQLELPVDSSADQFVPVKCKGRFEHEKEMLVGLRTRVSGEPGQAMMGGGVSKVGYLVITPFKTQSNQRILVNRGWVPRQDKSNTARYETEEVEITGIIRQGEQQSVLGVPNAPERREWITIDTNQMSSWTDAEPVLIEMTQERNENLQFKRKGFPLLKEPHVELSNNHLGYAITWFGLCIASTAMILRKRRISRW